MSRNINLQALWAFGVGLLAMAASSASVSVVASPFA